MSWWLLLSACWQPLEVGIETPWHDFDQDGFTEQDGDCDDENPSSNPGAQETCGPDDEDCDGLFDEDDPSAALLVWILDGDGDGWGGPIEVSACDGPLGYVLRGGDCDDEDDAIHPDGVETCAPGDEDCDQQENEDDAVDAPTWYPDEDGDGFGGDDDAVRACEAPPKHQAEGGDCDDTRPDVYTSAPEYNTDVVDSDCDGANDAPCGQAWWTVGDTDSVYPSITSALLDLAGRQCDGDTIEIVAPNYPTDRRLVLDRPVRLVGRDGVEIVGDGADGHPVLHVSAGSVESLTVRTGAGDDGGVVQVSGVGASPAPVSFTDVIIRDGTALSGGGMHVASTAGPVTLTRVTFVANTALRGGGLYVDAADVTCVRCVFEQNSATVAAGGMYAASDDITVDGARFTANTAPVAAGLQIAQGLSGDASIRDLVAVDNVATTGAGAAWLSGGAFSLTRVDVRGTHGGDAALRLDGVRTTDLVHLLIAGNDGDGVSIATSGSAFASVYVTNATIAANGSDGLVIEASSGQIVELTSLVLADNDWGIRLLSRFPTPTLTAVVYRANRSGQIFEFDSPGTGTELSASRPELWQFYHPDTAPERWDLHPRTSSVLRGLGPTATALRNPDGTVNDVGAYGGPSANFAYYDDLDADGMWDGWEERYGLYPFADDAADDADSDSLSNVGEFDLGTLPLRADSDDDGCPDLSDGAPSDPTVGC